MLLPAVWLLLMALGGAARAAPTTPFTRAFTDDVWFDGGRVWMQKTQASGARLVLLDIDWAGIEPRPPAPGVDPRDPSGPQYDFGYVDSVVRSFAGTGIKLAFLVTDAPQWAEAPGGPQSYEAGGAWKPDPVAFGALASALATRYSGSYPDPIHLGQRLPHVRYFQAWAEANFSIHLAPQWIRSGRKWRPAGPAEYRALLNAFYSGIKRIRQDDVVITSGFGPYGDASGPCSSHFVGTGCRTPPAAFLRDLLCLQGPGLKPQRCPNPAHFDALAIDPYEISSPLTPAVNRDDVTAPDIWKLTRILARALPLRRALPRAHKQLWVTEFSYDSNPPNPQAVRLATQARWLEQSFFVFWRQGVDTVVWYLLRDQPGADYASSYFSGVYFHNGRPKPSRQAFRFPFVVMSFRGPTVAWGISPRTGTVEIQRLKSARWRTVLRLHSRAGAVFVHPVPAEWHGRFRAQVGGQKSLTWIT